MVTKQHDPWLWTPSKTAYRYDEPELREGVANFNATGVFINAIEKMLDKLTISEDTPAIAAAVAIAQEYVRRIWFQDIIIDCIAEDDEADLEEDQDPQAIKDAAASFKETEAKLRSFLKLRERALETNPTHPTTNLLARHGELAATVANTAVLKHHTERIQDQTLLITQRQGHLLASWHNEINLLQATRYSDAAEEAIKALETYEEICAEFEEHRPLYTSPRAQAMDTDLTNTARGQLMEHDAEEVEFLIDDLPPNQWLMAYLYQGAVYVKHIEEPYQHPIHQDKAIEHANQITSMLKDLIPYIDEDDEDLDSTRRHITLMHCAALQMADSNLHNVKVEHLHRFLSMAWDEVHDQGRVNAVAKALTGDRPLATQRITQHFTPPKLLERYQANALMDAATQAGVPPQQLREICRRLDIDPENLWNPPPIHPEPARWFNVSEMMEWTYQSMAKARERALAVAQAMGWDQNDPRVQAHANYLDMQDEEDQLD